MGHAMGLMVFIRSRQLQSPKYLRSQEGEFKMSKKKGAKGMPNEGPGKHDPSKPQKNKSDAPLFNKIKGGITNERPRKTRI
jgi:hypothetical protein